MYLTGLSVPVIETIMGPTWVLILPLAESCEYR